MTKPHRTLSIFVKQREIILICVCFAALFLLPNLLDDYGLTLLIGAGIFAIVTMGFNLTFGVAGQINLAIGAFFACGAYSSALLTTQASWPPYTAAALGMAIAGSASYVLAWPTSRLRGLYVAMATLLVQEGATAFLVHAQWLTNGPVGVFNVQRPHAFGQTLATPTSFYYLVLAVGAFVFLALRSLLRSRAGRAFHSVREDEEVARSLGIKATHYKVASFVIGGMVASIAGSLYAHFNGYVSPSSFDISFSIQVLSMAVVGGLGRNVGAVLGAFAISLVPQYLVQQLPSDTANIGLWQDLIFGLSMLFVLMWATRGLAGLFDAIPRLVALGRNGRRIEQSEEDRQQLPAQPELEARNGPH